MEPLLLVLGLIFAGSVIAGCLKHKEAWPALAVVMGPVAVILAVAFINSLLR